MALILFDYIECFCSLTRADMSNPYWFSRKERIFRRQNEIQEAKWCDNNEWILVPRLCEYDLYRTYLHITGRESVIDTLNCKDEQDFCVKLRFFADANRFDTDLNKYTGQIIQTVMYRWMVENKIPNVRISQTPVPVEFWDLPKSEAVLKVREYLREQYKLEKEDEEAYKAKVNQKMIQTDQNDTGDGSA